MATLDVFNQNPFGVLSMAQATDRIPYVPRFLDTVPNLFETRPIRTKSFFLEERLTKSGLIRMDARGAPPRARATPGPRVARDFPTRRIADQQTLTADEIADVRAFGSESEVQAMQVEIADRQMLMRRDMETTFENMRLGAVQGLAVDGDATVVDWASELGQTIPTELDFDLDTANPASGAVRKKCNAVTRSIRTGLEGQGGDSVAIYGLCGDAFWDDLTAHPEVRETYLYTQQAADLRAGNAWESFRYGGITFVNYRGTDDGTTVAIHADKCKFFPAGAGIFLMVYSPAERFEFNNTLGRRLYSFVVPDRDRNMSASLEMYSYPLPVCTMPQALHRARRT